MGGLSQTGRLVNLWNRLSDRQRLEAYAHYRLMVSAYGAPLSARKHPEGSGVMHVGCDPAPATTVPTVDVSA